ncbi:MAG: DUF4169 family protein [Rhodobacteraceae bacterium]|nr:DUF4169 family protein [Paracoccaceae bacterium]
MPKVVNLTRARKAVSRAKKTLEATENAAKYGRSKADKRLAATKTDKEARQLDQHRLERDD